MVREFNKQRQRYADSKYKKRAGNALIYLLVELIQLINGSRISEAILAFRMFVDEGFDKVVRVKISKSESTKHICDRFTGEKKTIKTPLRTRDMIPIPSNWLDPSIVAETIECLKATHSKTISSNRLRTAILNYMLRKFNCNTHSLRYAYINYTLNSKQFGESQVALYVGHSNINQIMRYTQRKVIEKMQKVVIDLE